MLMTLRNIHGMEMIHSLYDTLILKQGCEISLQDTHTEIHSFKIIYVPVFFTTCYFSLTHS